MEQKRRVQGVGRNPKRVKKVKWDGRFQSPVLAKMAKLLVKANRKKLDREILDFLTIGGLGE
jgi:hypothetical protein